MQAPQSSDTKHSGLKIQLNNQDSDVLHLVVVHYPLRYGLVQHLLVPLLQALRLWDLLIRRVTVEDVVVSFAGWAGPDVSSGVAKVGGRRDTTGTINTKQSRLWVPINNRRESPRRHLKTQYSPQFLDILDVADEDFMIDCCS